MPRAHQYSSEHLRVEVEIDEMIAVIIQEADFTERPLYVYPKTLKEAAAEFRAIAEWLDNLPE